MLSYICIDRHRFGWIVLLLVVLVKISYAVGVDRLIDASQTAAKTVPERQMTFSIGLHAAGSYGIIAGNSRVLAQVLPCAHRWLV